jgi:hypothetical protein
LHRLSGFGLQNRIKMELLNKHCTDHKPAPLNAALFKAIGLDNQSVKLPEDFLLRL